MKIDYNVEYTTRNHLCTGCGVCEDVCPKHCIAITRLHAEHRPIIDESKCLGNKCSRCLKTCPGIGINLLGMAKEMFCDVAIKEDEYIGRFIGIHAGYSKNQDIRFHSASGGMVSQFLVFLLDKKIIDGAVVTGYADDHITPKSYIARSKEDILNARSSKYCPVALNKVGNEIAKSDGKYVIVGLPCHIQGFRKRAEIDKRFRDRVIGYFSIYCSSNRTFNAQDFIFKSLSIKKNDIGYFAYRDDGCLGNLTILTKSGGGGEEFPSLRTMESSTKCRESESLKKISIPYTSYYGRKLRSFFKPHRCLTCIDHYGELADVCFGDLHVKPYSDDKTGISSWITRSVFWENMFEKAADEGYILMENISPDLLNKSQAEMLFPKKRRAKVVTNIDGFFGKTTPVYDKLLEKPHLKDYVSEIVCFAQQFIGRHRSLWPIIYLVNKGKKL